MIMAITASRSRLMVGMVVVLEQRLLVYPRKLMIVSHSGSRLLRTMMENPMLLTIEFIQIVPSIMKSSSTTAATTTPILHPLPLTRIIISSRSSIL